MSNETAVAVLSVIALLLTVIILVPQAYSNYKNGSTAGVSALMMQCFLFAAIMSGVYDAATDQAIGVTLSWFGFSIIAIVCLCQDPYYNLENIAKRTDKQRKIRFVYHFIAYHIICGLISIATYFVFVVAENEDNEWVMEAVGYVAPLILTIGGYLVQFRLIVKNKSSAGISVGFMLVDAAACIVSITTIALDGFDGAAASPFICIILCQIVLATFRFVVYPPSKSTAAHSIIAMAPIGENESGLFDDDDDDSDVELNGAELHDDSFDIEDEVIQTEGTGLYITVPVQNDNQNIQIVN